jgi:serine/threonine-protein kinase
VHTAPFVPPQSSTFPREGEILLEKYAVERVLGEGGMGAVLRARHVLRQVPVALKFIHPNVLAIPGAVERFYNEAVAASRIANEHVVQIFDVDRLVSGVPFIVMEFLEGRDLASALESSPGHRVSVPRAVHVTIQTLRALSVAHRAGVVHRDMKPSNVFLVERDGDPDFVKLVDFGISKVRSGEAAGEASLTQVNSTLGTPLYMSPEQARSAREVDSRSDLYAVGVMLYEMLAGRTPYLPETGELTEILYKLFTTEPPGLGELRPDLDANLVAIVARAMAKDPDRRYPTAGEFAADLAAFADERSANELHRMRQAELAAGGAASEAFESPRRSVQVRSAQAFDPNEGFGATQMGTAVGASGPIVVGRGRTEAMPVSSTPELAAATGSGSSTTVFEPPAKRPTVALLAVAALVVAAGLAVALRKGDAPAQGTAAPQAAPTAPAPPIAAEPPHPSPAAEGPRTTPPATELAAPVSAKARPAEAKAADLKPAAASKSPANANASGKPRLNDLGIQD